ncbi:MAG: LCP family protein [Faecalicatena sp.]|uniref:LCP family glycopolymer transferase n=1 Tax=Faecalicatena sp. TaxID=2005360 RepID=UPI0025841671|nr:LCP family protein [Faecalicatena sp.]MCI6465939.1 LCP family protein [Faecalicatena sp.]MDY5618644.1 LCP family protein [Lachnospiraceae bacterium]
MGQKNMSDSEREAYRREQAAKRRRMEARQGAGGEPVKSGTSGKRRPKSGAGESNGGAKRVNKGGAKSGPDRGGLGEAKGSSGRGSAKANPGRPGTSKGKPNRIGGKANPGRPSGGGPKNGPKGGPKSGPKKNAGTRNAKGRKNASNKVSKQVGIILCGIQFAVTLVFIAALFILNMLPMKYLGIIIGVLAFLWIIPLVSQLISKKKAIAGKVLSVLMSIVLVFGSYYIFKTNGTVKAISGGDKKVDKMVVAVLSSDPAETIDDAKKYNFGVQYALKGDDMRATIEEINSETGRDIATVEYKSLNEQAEALHDGDVSAIIYNDAYTSILEESFEGFSDSIKIIYSHEITSKLVNKAADVKVDDDCFTVYISGIDVFGAIETNSRSDVNMIAVVNPTTHQILLVTTPRDFYVEIPGISGGQKDKLTHAGIYGVDASMATLSSLYDTEIDFYARVNFTSLIEMVDALGGVDVDSEQSFTTSDDSGLVMNVAQGMNHFNGKQALAFSRERYNVDGGDFQRGRNQQAVITAMIKKAISPAILTGANGLLSSVSGNVDTNMSQEQIQELIKSQLAEGAAWNIKSMSAEGTGDEQECYSSPGNMLYVTQPDMNSITAIKQAIDAVEKGETLPDSVVAE